MTILNSIQQVQELIQQLSSNPKIAEDTELNSILTLLNSEVESIKSKAEKLSSQAGSAQVKISGMPHIDAKSGCYKFDNEQGFFCPNCYDQSSNRVQTKRLNKQLRVCPTCRASIKPV